MRTKEIYARRMAAYLRECGFNVIEVKVNPWKPQFDMWVFEDTDELRKAMSKFNKDNK